MADIADRLLDGVGWLRPWRDQAVARELSKVLSLPIACCPFLDPERDTFESVLDRLMLIANGGEDKAPHPFAHPVQQALNELVAEDEAFTTDVRLGDVAGIACTKGGKDTGLMGFHMNLDRLPETMCLKEGESYGPLCEAEMFRLRTAVRGDLPVCDGRLELTLQTWDGTYIVRNDGASRRFALLRRLSRSERFKAHIRPLHLSTDALRLMRGRWRVVVVAECDGFQEVMDRIQNLAGRLFWCSSGDKSNARVKGLLLAIPYEHQVSTRLLRPVGELHRKLDEAGAFDIGRHITERISVAKQRRFDPL